MQGKRGQGDKYNQREIIKGLIDDKRTRLCIVVDRYALFSCQEDTTIPLEYPYHLVSLLDIADNICELINNLDKYIELLFNKMLRLNGLVAVNTLELDRMSDFIITKIEEYYDLHIECDVNHKVHYIFIDISK